MGAINNMLNFCRYLIGAGRDKAFFTSNSSFGSKMFAFLIAPLWFLYTMDSKRSFLFYSGERGSRRKQNPLYNTCLNQGQRGCRWKIGHRVDAALSSDP